MTIFFNFFGGPGTGKSTASAHCFSESKDDQYNSEYVQEKAKEWAWEKRDIKLKDQFELFNRQSKREQRLHHEASVVFADSPVWLCAYYSTLQSNFHAQKVFEQMCKEYYEENKTKGIIYYNIWLYRVKPYNPKGRFQTEEQAKAIDGHMKPYLESLGVTFLECPGVKEEAYKLVRNILSGYPEAKVTFDKPSSSPNKLALIAAKLHDAIVSGDSSMLEIEALVDEYEEIKKSLGKGEE